MTSDEIISRYGLLHAHEPMSERIERAIGEARRLRVQTFGDTTRTAATWLAQVMRGREVRPAHPDGASNPVYMA
jgi:hypothetical protein